MHETMYMMIDLMQSCIEIMHDTDATFIQYVRHMMQDARYTKISNMKSIDALSDTQYTLHVYTNTSETRMMPVGTRIRIAVSYLLSGLNLFNTELHETQYLRKMVIDGYGIS